MTLAFWKNSSNFLTIYNFDDFDKIIQVEIPRGKWVWIQVEHNENYFGVHVEDQSGKIIKKGTDKTYHITGQNYRTNVNVQIGERFYGYIYGIQYFKNLQESKEPDQMSEPNSSNSSLLFYYKIGENLENLAVNDRIVHKPLEKSGDPFYDRIPFNPPSSNVQWGGVTCEEPNRILTLSKDSNLQLGISGSPSYLQIWIWQVTGKVLELKDSMSLEVVNGRLRCSIQG